MKRPLVLALGLGLFLTCPPRAYSQSIDIGLNEHWFNLRVTLVYGPEVGSPLLPFPKFGVQYVPFEAVSPYLGACFGFGNILIAGWGSVSAYAGIQIFYVFAEVAYTFYDASYLDLRIFRQRQLNPRLGINHSTGIHLGFGPTIIIEQETNIINPPRTFPNFIPLIEFGGFHWNIEIGFNSNAFFWAKD